MVLKIWNRKPPTREMLEDRRKQIEEQRAILELEIEIENEAVAFQQYKLEWMDGRITLDEILADDTWSLCKRISKMRGERANRSPFKISEETQGTDYQTAGR